MARYYSSTQGRFTSPDIPFADQSEGDPQSWNLYVYVGNNPLTYTDPFGMWKQVSCSVGNCWEAEEGDTLKTLAKQSGVGIGALGWAFSGTTITPGETVISTTGVKEDFRAWADEAMRQMPLFEPATGGGIIKLGQAGASAAGSLLSRAWAGARNYFKSRSGVTTLGLSSPTLPIATRLELLWSRLSQLRAAKGPEAALKQLSKQLDEIEDAYSGIAKNPNPGLRPDGRMYPPQSDFITKNPDGSWTAITRGHRIELGSNGSIGVFSRKTGETIFTKLGGGQ